MLLTHAVQPDASEVISEAWFYVATHFLTEIWDRRCWHQKAGIFFQSENGNKYSRWPVKLVFPVVKMVIVESCEITATVAPSAGQNCSGEKSN